MTSLEEHLASPENLNIICDKLIYRIKKETGVQVQKDNKGLQKDLLGVLNENMNTEKVMDMIYNLCNTVSPEQGIDSFIIFSDVVITIVYLYSIAFYFSNIGIYRIKNVNTK